MFEHEVHCPECGEVIYISPTLRRKFGKEASYGYVCSNEHKLLIKYTIRIETEIEFLGTQVK